MKPYGVKREQTLICQERTKCKKCEHYSLCDSDTQRAQGKGLKFVKAKERRKNKSFPWQFSNDIDRCNNL